MAEYDRYENEGNGGGFMMGLLTGTVLGAGLGMLLAPKAGSELRGAIGEQARNIGNVASEGYRKAADVASEQYRKASDTASTWSDKGRDLVDKARDAVSRRGEEARGYAGATPGSSSYGTSGSTGSTGTSGSSSSFGTGSSGSPDIGRS
jgi:gas vesicle protein